MRDQGSRIVDSPSNPPRPNPQPDCPLCVAHRRPPVDPRAMRFMLIVVILAQAQLPPWEPKNLRYFPKDITREALVQRMREFSFALNVRCQFCHAGGDGISFDGVDFGSDDKPAKVKARAMLKMMDVIN